jgi:peptide chain release factor 2
LTHYQKNSSTFGGHFDVDKKRNRLKEIEGQEALEGFWEDASHAAKVQQEKALLQIVVSKVDKLVESLEEFEILFDYGLNEGDEESAREALVLVEDLALRFEEVEQQALLGQEEDQNNAIITINAGAGGTESCDWAYMLERMVLRYCDKLNFKTTLVDEQSGDAAGIKSATILAEGPFAYGKLRSESGIHRLVRISPFDSNARRHTSFASVFASPEVDDDIEIEMLDKDLRIDVFRASGAGGQSVNTTDSAVRITHLPTNLVAVCRNERSQLQNKQMAMKILKSRLHERAMQEKREKEAETEASKKKIEWGSQIRSYVLHPYKMVKDHRTGYEMSAPDKVLDGELEGFVKAYLQWDASEQEET